MKHWLFLLSLGVGLSLARAELPLTDAVNPSTNRPGPVINVLAPVETPASTKMSPCRRSRSRSLRSPYPARLRGCH